MPVLNIDGVIGIDVTSNFVRDFLSKNENQDIILEISSPGGSVFDGINIFNMIKNHKGTVTTHIMGLAASMGSIIALAGDKITAEENAVFMIHNARSFAGGDHRELQKMANLIENISNLLAKIYVEKTKKTLKEIRSLMDDETFFFGNEIKDFGFADEIIESESKEDEATALINAQSRISSCVNTMKESERSKNDINKAAALLVNDDLNNNHKEVSNEIDNVVDNAEVENVVKDHNNKNTEVSKMTLEDLKAKNPDLYNQVFNLGAQSVKDNIEAHAEWFDVAPKQALEAIKNNEEFTTKHASKYAKAQMNFDDIKNHQTDSDNIPTVTPVEDNQDQGDVIALAAFDDALSGQGV
jgi:ATP-dependent Clp endopeptidase proteolytic subunit ClpP